MGDRPPTPEPTSEINYTDMVISISNLATAMDVRNEIDCGRLKIDERREIREFRFKIIMLSILALLAGIKVAELTQII